MSESRPVLAKASIWIIASSFCFGSLSTITVLAARAGLPLLRAMLWRYLIAVVLLFFLARKNYRDVEILHVIRLMAIGAVGQALITYLSLRALDYLPVGPLAFLFYTYPAWVTLIAAISGKERLTLVRLTALAIAMTGIAVMVGAPATGSLDRTGVLLALGTALLFALYLPALHKAQAGVRSEVAAFYLVCGVLASFLISSLITNQVEPPGSPEQWSYVLLLSLVCTVAAFATLIAGLRVLGPVRTSIVSTVEPFFTALLGVLFLRETPAGTTFAGGALVAVAVVILQVSGAAREADAAVL